MKQIPLTQGKFAIKENTMLNKDDVIQDINEYLETLPDNKSRLEFLSGLEDELNTCLMCGRLLSPDETRCLCWETWPSELIYLEE